MLVVLVSVLQDSETVTEVASKLSNVITNATVDTKR